MIFQARRPRLSHLLFLSGSLPTLLGLASCAWAQQAVQSPLTQAAAPEPGHLTVRLDRPGVKISPQFYGLMTEEINHSYDGGLYAELIRNRVLKDDARGPAFWSVVPGQGAATIALDTSQPVPGAELSNSLRLDVTKPGAGVANEGYWGIPVRANTRYQASFWAKSSPGFSGPLTLSIESNDGSRTLASARVPALSEQWKKYSVALNAGAFVSPPFGTPFVSENRIGPFPRGVGASQDNRFAIRASGTGSIWMTQVSLMPPTFNNRANGLRPDLMQLMGAMKPSFLRLPGGNYLEGNTIEERFDWKKTLGPIEGRPGHQGPWGYRSTDGMGLLEFLTWCEDLKVEPLLAVFAGYALQGAHVEPGPALQPFVQDALDEIEYVSGPVTSTWGARRARDGHPAPFPLRTVEIGNEDWFDKSGSYDGRYAQFHDAIKARHPRLHLIATMPVKSRVPDLIDDHYYRSARAMADDAGHYDGYNRQGPKIFVGEWASTEGSPTPTLQAALGDAAWLTGLERNSDVVAMQCYAPLLVNVNEGARQWGTNLIGYDALNAFGSPSYYVQAMFGQNTGDTVLPVEVTAAQAAGSALPSGKVGVATWNTQAEFKDLRVTGANGQVLLQRDLAGANAAEGVALEGGQWTAQDGALRQSSNATAAVATLGEVSWTDYTLSLKARKISGAEGFLIPFHWRDAQNHLWWNIGGWGNKRSAIERVAGGASTQISRNSPVTVETGRWYDVRIEVKGRSIRCFLDNALVNEAMDAPPSPIYAAASRDTRSGEVILKVVNFSNAPQPLQIDLAGARLVARTARAQVLEGQLGDVNSVQEPLKVAPRGLIIPNTGRTFSHQFPPNSVTVIRLGAR